MQCAHVYALFLMFVFATYCEGQNKTDLPKDNIKPETKKTVTLSGPKLITRNIIQDRKGNIWLAAFDGIFRYDGKSFTNITNNVSSERFFSVLEDRKGNFRFGSIGSGVYYYDERSFRNFTTKEGLAGNGVTCIYEDKTGNFWFGTWDNVCVYNGKTFTNFLHNGKPFKNVRTIIKDKKGNIWLGGIDGLWRYSNGTFTNFTQNFVGYIYEDKKGNIWTSSESANRQDLASSGYDEKSLWGFENAKGRWVLSRYDERSLSNKKPAVTEIKPEEGMICGILEATDGNIWFGASKGVYRYNGSTISSFKR